MIEFAKLLFESHLMTLQVAYGSHKLESESRIMQQSTIVEKKKKILFLTMTMERNEVTNNFTPKKISINRI